MSAYTYVFLGAATMWPLISLILMYWHKPRTVLLFMMWGAVVLEIMAIVGYVRW